MNLINKKAATAKNSNLCAPHKVKYKKRGNPLWSFPLKYLSTQYSLNAWRTGSAHEPLCDRIFYVL
jgi:hypothetical protein